MRAARAARAGDAVAALRAGAVARPALGASVPLRAKVSRFHMETASQNAKARDCRSVTKLVQRCLQTCTVLSGACRAYAWRACRVTRRTLPVTICHKT